MRLVTQSELYLFRTNVRGATWVRRGAAIVVPVNHVVVHIQRACTITGWAIYTRGIDNADTAGSCEIDIWRAVSGAYPPTVANSIVASAPPQLTAAKYGTNTSLTGWTTALAEGDSLLFRLVSSSNFGSIFFSLSF